MVRIEWLVSRPEREKFAEYVEKAEGPSGYTLTETMPYEDALNYEATEAMTNWVELVEIATNLQASVELLNQKLDCELKIEPSPHEAAVPWDGVEKAPLKIETGPATVERFRSHVADHEDAKPELGHELTRALRLRRMDEMSPYLERTTERLIEATKAAKSEGGESR